MKYWVVEWHHYHQDEPIKIYSELDDERNELRKVEVYANGNVGYATANEEVGDTRLSLYPLPELEEIAKDPEFGPKEISKAEFDTIWIDKVLKEG